MGFWSKMENWLHDRLAGVGSPRGEPEHEPSEPVTLSDEFGKRVAALQATEKEMNDPDVRVVKYFIRRETAATERVYLEGFPAGNSLDYIEAHPNLWRQHMTFVGNKPHVGRHPLDLARSQLRAVGMTAEEIEKVEFVEVPDPEPPAVPPAPPLEHEAKPEPSRKEQLEGLQFEERNLQMQLAANQDAQQELLHPPERLRLEKVTGLIATTAALVDSTRALAADAAGLEQRFSHAFADHVDQHGAYLALETDREVRELLAASAGCLRDVADRLAARLEGLRDEARSLTELT